MRLHGLDADPEDDGDALVRLSLGDKLDDLPFTRSELFRIGRGLGTQIALQQRLRDAGGEIGMVPGNRFERLDQFFLALALVKITSGARSEEHTSETPVTNAHLVCRLLLEKKKT